MKHILVIRVRMIFCGSLVSLVVGLVLFGEVVECFPSGPPTSVCSSLIPVGHTGTGQASDAPGDFFIYTSLLNDGNNGAYLAGTTYNGIYNYAQNLYTARGISHFHNYFYTNNFV